MADDQIVVGINADGSAFEASLQSLSAAADESFAQLSSAIQSANAVSGSLGANVTISFQKAKTATESWQKSFKPLVSSFESSITGMILGTTTWQKAVQNLAQTALRQMVNAAVEGMLSWNTSEEIKTAATTDGVGQRTAIEASGQSAGLAQMAINALKTIGMKAASTAANVYENVSAIPYVGWILAPPAAAAAFAAVMAFGSLVPSAAGGMWNVPADTLALVHKQESIIPASVAQPMRDFFSSGASGGASYAITIQAIDTQSGAQFLMNNAPLIAKSLAREIRNGNPALRKAV